MSVEDFVNTKLRDTIQSWLSRFEDYEEEWMGDTAISEYEWSKLEQALIKDIEEFIK